MQHYDTRHAVACFSDAADIPVGSTYSHYDNADRTVYLVWVLA